MLNLKSHEEFCKNGVLMKNSVVLELTICINLCSVPANFSTETKRSKSPKNRIVGIFELLSLIGNSMKN